MLRIKIVLFCSLLLINCEKNPVDNNKSTPPDEERILFIRNVKNKLSQICTMKPDGSDIKVISQTEVNLYNIGYIHARWSPDKSKVVVVGGPESSPDIFPLWLMDMSGNFCQKLSHNGFQPIWKNEDEIIYHKPRGYTIGSTQDIFLISIKEEREFIIFQQTDTFSIRISDLDTVESYGIGSLYDKSLNPEKYDAIAKFQIGNWTNYNILYDNNAYLSVQPRLLPNKEKLIFVKGIYRNNDIYSLDLSSGVVVNLTNNPSEYRNISCSPDGSHIAFSRVNSNLTGEFEECEDIFIMDIETRSIINITNTASDSISNHVMDWK